MKPVWTLREAGKKVAAIRHPMPYGDLTEQVCQRYAELSDLDRYRCTIEEREEYEPHIAAGTLVFAGVDYAKILEAAQNEADVILWDGGNNDLPFIKPDLHITLVDPHRPGHELSYQPGETNLRMADVVVINKVETASSDAIDTVRANVSAVNPEATQRDRSRTPTGSTRTSTRSSRRWATAMRRSPSSRRRSIEWIAMRW